MTRNEQLSKVLQVLGGTAGITVRERYNKLFRGETDEISLTWEEIKDTRALGGLTFWDGQAGVTIKLQPKGETDDT